VAVEVGGLALVRVVVARGPVALADRTRRTRRPSPASSPGPPLRKPFRSASFLSSVRALVSERIPCSPFSCASFPTRRLPEPPKTSIPTLSFAEAVLPFTRLLDEFPSRTTPSLPFPVAVLRFKVLRFEVPKNSNP
jgi:hypothetical protein